MIDQARKAQVKFWIDGLCYRLQRPFQAIRGPHRSIALPSGLTAFASRDEYNDHHRQLVDEYKRRNRFLRELEAGRGPFLTDAFCIACGRQRRFRTDAPVQGPGASGVINWREGVICQDCGLNSRMRASVHLALCVLGIHSHCRVYVTEQITALYRWIKLRFPEAMGSEYLRDGTQPGRTNRYGVRHEDLTALSFADDSFDFLISLEVMEHIPNYREAFLECARVLRPGGKMLLSVPFHPGVGHIERARVRGDGTIEHLLPPEFHGDPLDTQGCLCFHHFGWDVLEDLKAAGFREATAQAVWSPELGYLAGEGEILQFIAVK